MDALKSALETVHSTSRVQFLLDQLTPFKKIAEQGSYDLAKGYVDSERVLEALKPLRLSCRTTKVVSISSSALIVRPAWMDDRMYERIIPVAIKLLDVSLPTKAFRTLQNEVAASWDGQVVATFNECIGNALEAGLPKFGKRIACERAPCSILLCLLLANEKRFLEAELSPLFRLMQDAIPLGWLAHQPTTCCVMVA